MPSDPNSTFLLARGVAARGYPLIRIYDNASGAERALPNGWIMASWGLVAFYSDLQAGPNLDAGIFVHPRGLILLIDVGVFENVGEKGSLG